MKYETIQSKSLLSKHMEADPWFHIHRSLNPYRGCEHACAYCDGMSEYYHVDNFASHIRIKENAPDILRRELQNLGYLSQSSIDSETLIPFMDSQSASEALEKRKRKIVIGVSGGVSDAYQPAEEKHEVTKKILEVLLDFEMPVFILTKSDLVLRDLDLLEQIHEKAFANVSFTITLTDKEKQQIFEPKTSTTEERFDALRQVRKAGLYGGVMASPIIPGIGDDEENMINLAKIAMEVDAQYIQFAGMTLKPGRQKQHFMRVLRNHYPDDVELIKRVYANDNRYGHPIRDELPINVMMRGHRICKEIGIRDISIRHQLPSEPDANHRVLSTLLEIIMRQRWYLGLPKSRSASYHDLARRIDTGLPDLSKLRKNRKLKDELAIGDELIQIVEEILDTDSCSLLKEINDAIGF